MGAGTAFPEGADFHEEAAMTGARMKVAKLDKAQLAKVKTLEKKLGCCVVALEPEYRLARLAPGQIKQLISVEKQLGVVLVAYEVG
jgi:hypothetical protein